MSDWELATILTLRDGVSDRLDNHVRQLLDECNRLRVENQRLRMALEQSAERDRT
jgi:regulator of replication initiation timing